MNIEQVREAREAAERAIEGLMVDFHRQTGLHITDVNVETFTGQSLGATRPDVFSQRVTVDLERV